MGRGLPVLLINNIMVFRLFLTFSGILKEHCKSEKCSWTEGSKPEQNKLRENYFHDSSFSCPYVCYPFNSLS